MNDRDEASRLLARGLELQNQGQLAAALAVYQQAVAVQPESVGAQLGLGDVLRLLRRFDEAEAAFRRVLALKPDDPHAILGLANLALDQDRLEDAIAGYRLAIALAPGMAEAHSNLGHALRRQGEVEAAIAAGRRAVALQPALADAHLNLSLSLLLHGELREGFREYEWRWKALRQPPRDLKRPRWPGGDLAGKRLLLHAEQGLGDTLHFCRFAPLLAAEAAAVILAVPPALVQLLRQAAWPKVTVTDGARLAGYDLELPLMSAPAALGTVEASIPAKVPYLTADPQRIAVWRERLPRDGFRIGVVWQGRPEPWLDRGRAFPLGALAPLARLPGVRLISLQRAHDLDQLAALPEGMRVDSLGPELDAGPDAFLDSAAVLTELDLVISADTAMAHLAGALGRPVWIALPFSPDWRWQCEREDSPWYPTARLFRQRAAGQWDEVFARMAAALPRLAAGQGRQLPPAAAAGQVLAPIPLGELIDKITILEIKAERLRDAAKLAHVQTELALLRELWERYRDRSAALEAMVGELKRINLALWEVEDELRLCERQGEFGARFLALARSVYQHNDQRAETKRAISLRLGSTLIEEKSYT